LPFHKSKRTSLCEVVNIPRIVPGFRLMFSLDNYLSRLCLPENASVLHGSIIAVVMLAESSEREKSGLALSKFPMSVILVDAQRNVITRTVNSNAFVDRSPWAMPSIVTRPICQDRDLYTQFRNPIAVCRHSNRTRRCSV